MVFVLNFISLIIIVFQQIYRLISSKQVAMKSLSNLSPTLRTSIISIAILCFILTGCDNKLAFEYKSYQRKTSLPCQDNCPHINVKIPYASKAPVVADSINKKIYME